MQITRNRIRRNYAPLNAAVSIAVDTSQDSALTQVYDERQNTWQPNRELTPLVLTPIVSLSAGDGSLAEPLGNKDISRDTMRWVLDGKDITTLAGWKDKVSVNREDGTKRGALTVMRNVPPGEAHSLYFECDVADTRTGKTAHIRTDTITLATTDKSEDDYSLSLVGNEAAVVYDPAVDPLAEMEYEEAQGTAGHSDSEKADAEADAASYTQEWKLQVRRGPTTVTSGYEAHYYLRGAGGARTEITADNMEDTAVTRADNTRIAVDARMVDNIAIAVEVAVDGKIVAAKTIGCQRQVSAASFDYVNKTTAHAKETYREDMVVASRKSEKLRYPQRTYHILWYVTDATGKDHEMHYGERTRYSLKEMGLADTAEIAEYIATEPKAEHCIATNGGSVLTANGETLIFSGFFGE